MVIATLMVVTYNRLDLTKRTFETTLNNTGCKFNLIIVDNNSTDGTIDWLKGYKNDNIENFVIHRLKENKGICYGRNMCLKLYSNFNTPYLCTLDNDVECGSNWLIDCCNVLEYNKMFGCCGVNFETVSFPKTKVKAGNCSIGIQIKPRGNLGTACEVFGKDVHDKIGFFNSEFKYYAHEDSDFGFRVRCLKKQLCYLEEPGIHLGVGENDSGEYRAMKDEYWKKNMPIFERNVRMYANKQKSLYCGFDDYDESVSC